MKKFKSVNDIQMVEGKLFNWELKPLYGGGDMSVMIHTISFVHDGDYWGCNWHEELLTIADLAYSSHCSVGIKCDLDMAEKIVVGFAEARGYEFFPLHKKS